MKITQTKIKQQPSRFPSDKDKPYVLYIPDYGGVGDKFNVGPSKSGKEFPPEASERFKTKAEARPVLEKFLIYVKARIEDAKKLSDKSKSSFRLWE